MTTAPDVAGAAVGWRVWRVDTSGQRVVLRSGVKNSVWPAGRPTRARCVGGHAPPGLGCGCGLYAVTDPGAVMGLAPTGGVLGLAALWGDVLEGTRGWRSATGSPVLLFTDPSVGERTRRRLAEVYGVPVHPAPMPLARLVTVLSGRLRPAADRLRAELELTTTRGMPAVDTPALREILRARPHPSDRSMVVGPVVPRVPRTVEAARAASRALLALVLGCVVPTLLGAWSGRAVERATGFDLGAGAVVLVCLVLLALSVVLAVAITSFSLEEGMIDDRVALAAGCAYGVVALGLAACAVCQLTLGTGGWSWVLVVGPLLFGLLHAGFAWARVDELSR